MNGAAGGTLLPGVHTVDEGERANVVRNRADVVTAISASSFVEIVRFFTALVLNVDESLT